MNICECGHTEEEHAVGGGTECLACNCEEFLFHETEGDDETK